MPFNLSFDMLKSKVKGLLFGRRAVTITEGNTIIYQFRVDGVLLMVSIVVITGIVYYVLSQSLRS